MKKHFCRKLMAVVLTIGVAMQGAWTTVPVRAEGTDACISLGTNALASPDKVNNANTAWSGDYIYLGSYYQEQTTANSKQPVKWRVLDVTGEHGSSSQAGGILLMADQVLDQVAFNENAEAADANQWKCSDLADWMNSTKGMVTESAQSGTYTAGGFYDNAFSEGEKAAILAGEGEKAANTDNFVNQMIDNRKMFILAPVDMLDADYGFHASAIYTYGENMSRKFTATTYALAQGVAAEKGYAKFWLRAGYKANDSVIAITSEGGYIAGWGASRYDIGVVPAMNVEKDAILFTSPATEEGSETGKAEKFAKVETADVSEWKVTLKDDNSFAQGTSVKVNDNVVDNAYAQLSADYQKAQVTVTHKALQDIDKEYTDVTAALMTTDENGNADEMLYYGSIQDNTQATSSSFSIPSGLSAGIYKLCLWGEDRNAAKETDYATKTPFEMTVEVVPESGHTHVFGDWKNTTNCETGTVEKRICSICKMEETREATNRSHEWEQAPTVDVEATCTADGSQSVHCKNCNEVKDKTVIKATGHTGGYATCAAKAECKVCGQEYGELLAHEYNDVNWCCDAGAHWKECVKCGSRKEIAVHTWKEEKVISDSVLTTQKIKVSYCTVCNMKKTELLTEDGTVQTPPEQTNDVATTQENGNSSAESTTKVPTADNSETDNNSPAEGTTKAPATDTSETNNNSPADSTTKAPATDNGETNNNSSAESTTKVPTADNSETNNNSSAEGTTKAPTTDNSETNNNSPAEGTTKVPTTDNSATDNNSSADSTTKAPATDTSATNNNTPVDSTTKAATDNTANAAQPVEVGSYISSDAATYQILTAASANETGNVSYVAPDNKKLVSVSIPETITYENKTYQVTAIADKAFYKCKKLKTVKTGNNVITIGKSAFASCIKLQTVVIGKRVKKIQKKAFYGCKKLQKLTIQTSQLKASGVGAKAFYKAGGSNYKKCKVKVPKKKVAMYRNILRNKGLSKKVSVR